MLTAMTRNASSRCTVSIASAPYREDPPSRPQPNTVSAPSEPGSWRSRRCEPSASTSAASICLLLDREIFDAVLRSLEREATKRLLLA
jgi:hypothetical protein